MRRPMLPARGDGIETGSQYVEGEYLLRISDHFTRLDRLVRELDETHNPRRAQEIANISRQVCLMLAGRLGDEVLSPAVLLASEIHHHVADAMGRGQRWVTRKERLAIYEGRADAVEHARQASLEVYEELHRVANKYGIFAHTGSHMAPDDGEGLETKLPDLL